MEAVGSICGMRCIHSRLFAGHTTGVGHTTRFLRFWHDGTSLSPPQPTAMRKHAESGTVNISPVLSFGAPDQSEASAAHQTSR